MVFESCASARGLLDTGYRQTDTMTVLRSTALPKAGQEPEVGRSTDPEGWSRAYLLSFYGDEGMTEVVEPIVSSLRRSRSVTLLEAKTRGETAGVLAMCRTPGILGVYCVGTVPEFRGHGTATALLAQAIRTASAEKRSLILQTLTSDGALRFYLRRGFEVMYAKRVLTRKLI